MKTIGKVALLAGIGALTVVGGLIHKRVKEDKETEDFNKMFPDMGTMGNPNADFGTAPMGGPGMGFGHMGTPGGMNMRGFGTGGFGLGGHRGMPGFGMGGAKVKGPFSGMGFGAPRGMDFKGPMDFKGFGMTNADYDDPFTAPRFYSSFEQEKAHEQLKSIFDNNKLELSKFIATCTDDGIESEDFISMLDKIKQIVVENSKREESKPGCCKDCQGH